MTVRWPPFQVVPYGKDLMVRCSECGDVRQICNIAEGTKEYAEREARHVGREHQRWEHPSEEERMLDSLRMYEVTEMADYCERCGVGGHESKECPTVTPDLLKGSR